MGPSLYQWVYNGEYEQWLIEHLDSSIDVMTISHASRKKWERGQVARNWELCEVLTEEDWLQRGLTP